MVPQLFKSTARRLLASVRHGRGLNAPVRAGKVLILMYHRILPVAEAREGWVQPGMYVTPESFELQLRFLKRHFELPSLEELLAGWSDGSVSGAARFCAITFDDGWLDNYTHAFPILKELQVPATVFLPTGFIGTRRWFWPERLTRALRLGGTCASSALARHQPALRRPLAALPGARSGARAHLMDAIIEKIKRLPDATITALVSDLEEELGVGAPRQRLCMSSDELQEMSNAGIGFGAHSVTHRILTGLPGEEARAEIEVSGRELSGSGLRDIQVFCYPNGGHDARIRELVRRSGYRAAVTTDSGYEDAEGPADPFAIRRIGVHNDISSTASLFWNHLSRRQRGSEK